MEELLAEVPRKWEKLGDAVLLPRGSFAHGAYALPSVALALWPTVARALHAELVAKQDEIKQNGMRQSQVRLLWGREDGWVEHWEGGVVYGLDITRVMFSSGNVTEKARMGSLECKGEVVVDWYAGIGYYTIPLLVKAQAQHVFACEWNPDSVKALNFNLQVRGGARRLARARVCASYPSSRAEVCLRLSDPSLFEPGSLRESPNCEPLQCTSENVSYN